VSDAWMPGVRYVRSERDGGSLKGGAPRVVWEALGADPRAVSARSAAERLDKAGHASHLVWNPLNGEIVQLIPIVRAARSLGSALGPAVTACQPGHPVAEVNNEGRVCVQICVVAYAQEPFTDGPLARLQEIMTWLDAWKIPRTWPAGQPAPFPDCHLTPRSRRLWARGGHFGGSQVPGLTAAGPGAIDTERLTGWSAGRATVQAAAPRADGARRPADYESEAFGELLVGQVASAASLSRVR
jgi:hypothetical protein